MSDHREKAVEAAERQVTARGMTPLAGGLAAQIIDAADPHLRRAHFEEFKEAALGDEVIEAAYIASDAIYRAGDGTAVEEDLYPAVLQAALDKAQELLEGGR
jgi:hypothetical protein